MNLQSHSAWISGAGGLVVGLFMALGGASPGQGADPAPQVELVTPHAFVIVEVKEGGRRLYGSGLLVAPDLVATDFGLIAGREDVRVAPIRSPIVNALGVAAASSGKRLVLLRLERPYERARVPKLAAATPEPRDKIGLYSTAIPLRGWGAGLIGFLVGLETGEQVVASLGESAARAAELDRDTIWLRTNILTGVYQCGGPLVNERDEVVGLAVALAELDDPCCRGVHVCHLRELLAAAGPTRPFSSLKTQRDVVPTQPTDLPEDLYLSDSLLDRGLSQVERLDRFNARRELLRTDLQELRRQERRLSAHIAALKSQVKSITAFEAQSLASAPALEPLGQRWSPTVIPDSRPRDRARERAQPAVPRVEFRPGEFIYSPEQIAAVQSAAAERMVLEMRRFQAASQAEYNSLARQLLGYELAVREKRQKRLQAELLLLADASGHRGAEDRRANVAFFTGELDKKSSVSLGRLGRGLACLHLGMLEQAREDFEVAANSGGALKHVASVALARLDFREGRSAEGRELVAKALAAAGRDPEVNLQAGLAACEQAKFAKACQFFTTALENGGDPAELHRLLALVYATAPQAQVRQASQARDHALQACAGTRWRDFGPLLALAAAKGELGQFADAAKLAGRAAELCEGDNQRTCQRWQTQLLAEQPIRSVWPAPAAPPER